MENVHLRRCLFWIFPYFIAYGALSLFLSIVFKTFKQIEASLVSHVIFAIDCRDLFADFTAYLTFAHL